ncbi:MAG: TIR domain-containing protein [Vicinamibacterales bacterium]
MPGVFISYRRQDSAGHTGRLFDRLQARLGRGRVFMDVTGIDAGVDFVQTIERAVGSCDALLAVIGPDWLSCTDANGQRRLDDRSDFIRIEISAALERNVRVIPVLIAGASLPPLQALPEDLKPLVRRQTVELRDSRWDADTNDLIATLEALLGADPDVAQATRKRKAAVLAAGALAAAIAIALPAAWYLAPADEGASPAPADAPTVPERVLDYSVIFRADPRQYPESAPTRVAEDRIFAAGDLLRFSFSSPQPGFLYVINESPPDGSGSIAFNILFPSPTSNGGSPRLAAGQELLIPEKGDGFVLDAQEGAEKLWLVWSLNRIDELDALRRWANPEDQGQIKGSTDIDALRNFLARNVTPAPQVQQNSDATRTTLKAPGEMFVKLVTLEHRR